MKQSEFDDLVRRKFAEFERQNGRVPTLKELSASLGVEERMLERKLKKALTTIGTDAQTEGTSAFKSTLRQVMSKGLLNYENPGIEDLQLLLLKGRQSKTGMASMEWEIPPLQFELTVQIFDARSKPEWTLCMRMSKERTFHRLFGVRSHIDELSEHIHPGIFRFDSAGRKENSERSESQPVENVVPFKRKER
ncbi:MAG: hypothetical protein C0507_17060 [Cyanobacteria bacterium PR.3.49]|nr:hypothetical protein [Cyanobacteria bacterium PR.3.49]